MKLSALAKKPQLQKITIDDEGIVEKYGDAPEFYIYDRYEMDIYMRLMNTEENDFHKMSKVCKELVMDEKGNAMLEKDDILPGDISVKVVETVIQHLGNAVNQTLAA
jgi:hypothetical protein